LKKIMQELKLAIFDVAGTVIEDHGEVVSSLVDALAAHGMGVNSEELAEFKGGAKREVIRFFGWRKRNEPLSDTAVEAVHDDFVRLVNGRYEEQLAPIPGAEEVFESLRKRGMQLALTSGFGQATVELVVRRLGWQDWFSARISSDEVAVGRPAPYLIFHAMERCRCRSVREVVNVGDTPLDLQSAANAGVGLNVGVLSGLFRRERLMSEPHDALLASVADLPTLLNRE
jgi:phosphonatase-like hydrolase